MKWYRSQNAEEDEICLFLCLALRDSKVTKPKLANEAHDAFLKSSGMLQAEQVWRVVWFVFELTVLPKFRNTRLLYFEVAARNLSHI